MSFALEFRKRHFLQADRPPQGRSLPSSAETRASRGVAFCAFVIAAAILAAFNSEGLRSAASDLASTQAGRGLIALTEAWDGIMEHAGAKSLVASVRDTVREARAARWSDVAGLVEAPVVALQDEKDNSVPLADKTITGALPASAGTLPKRVRSNGL